MRPLARLWAIALLLGGTLSRPLAAVAADLPTSRTSAPELPPAVSVSAADIPVAGAPAPAAPQAPVAPEAGSAPSAAQPAIAGLEAAAAPPAGPAAAPAALDELYTGSGRFGGGDAFDRAAAAWDQELLSDYRADPGRAMPDSLPRIGPSSQEANREHLYRTARPVLDTVGHFAAEAAHPRSPLHGQTFSQLLSSLADSIRARYLSNIYAVKLGSKAFQRSVGGMRDELAKSGVADVSAGDIEDFVRDYHAAVERYRAEYGAELFSDAAVRKAGFNAFAMHMFVALAGGKVENQDAMYAMALLHPITDDALDSGEDMGRAMRKISAALNGEHPAPETAYERVVLDFIGSLFEAFPPKGHPVFQRALQRLQEEQLRSVVLQKSGADRAALELNTLRKGALTSLVFGYAAMGGLTKGQVRFFYEAGFILQLIDDMLDVERDLRDGAATLWTKSWIRRDDAQAELRRLLALQRSLEGRSRAFLSGFSQGARFADAFNYGFKLFMTSAVFDPFKRPALAPVLEDRLPVKAHHLKTVVYTLVDRLRAEPTADLRLLEILDDGFLGGAYRASREGKRLKAPSSFRIGGYGPKWWWIGVSAFLQGWLGLVLTAKKDSPREALAVLSMVSWGALYVFGMLSNMTALGMRDMAGVVILATVVLFNMIGAWTVPVALAGLLATTLMRLLS